MTATRAAGAAMVSPPPGQAQRPVNLPENPPMPAGPYGFQLIDPLSDAGFGSDSATVAAINDAGEVLGTTAGGVWGQPFLYQDGSYTPLAVPGASRTLAAQLNAAGEVIGLYRNADSSANHAFLYDGQGGYSEIAVPGASSTTALQISDGGQVLVQYADDAGQHLAVDNNGTFTTIAPPDAQDANKPLFLYPPFADNRPLINSAGEVADTYNDDTGAHAFLYDGQGGYSEIAVPGAASTTANEINNAGQVLGVYGDGVPGDLAIPYVYSDGTYATVAVPGASSTTALAMNDAGQVAGTYQDDAGMHLFLETNGSYVTIASPFNSTPPGSIVSPGGLPVLSGTATTGDANILLPPTSSAYVILPPLTFIQLTNAGDVLARDNGAGGGTFVFSGGASAPAGLPDGAGAGATASVLRINDAGQEIGTFLDGAGLHAFLATPQGGSGGAADGTAAAGGTASPDPAGTPAGTSGPLLPLPIVQGMMLFGAADGGVLRA